jgi:uncharacterized protein (TIGR02271 family)
MPAAVTVIGTIESPKAAQKLIDELVEAGFRDRDVEILEGDEDELVAEIVGRGFDKEDARGYAEAVGRGKTVVAARASEKKAPEAAAIIERYETAAGGGSSREEQGETVQEVEEQLSVGKRKVTTGGVRVTTSVSERPVQKTVSLREEQVEVERRSTDRELRPEEAEAAFAEKTIEMLGTSEEVEVGKEARVVGEVSLGKRVEERKETVRDTVRRTEVEVEEVEPASRKAR